ncbi:MAG: LysE family transporter [Anaerolineae bacterium]|nr:LysE family transporter [Anaerolineae bacterium]
MTSNFLFTGLIIGFSIAAPVGPIGVLCIRRTLAQGRAVGLLSGLGAATADAFYGCVAGFSLTAISTLLLNQQFWLALGGGLFLCYLGVKTLRLSTTSLSTPTHRQSYVSAYASTFFLTITNPATILSFAAIFAGLGLVGEAGDYFAATILVLGVFAGSALWWLALSTGVSLLTGRIRSGFMPWINRISGLIILGFGVVILLNLASMAA